MTTPPKADRQIARYWPNDDAVGSQSQVCLSRDVESLEAELTREKNRLKEIPVPQNEQTHATWYAESYPVYDDCATRNVTRYGIDPVEAREHKEATYRAWNAALSQPVPQDCMCWHRHGSHAGEDDCKFRKCACPAPARMDTKEPVPQGEQRLPPQLVSDDEVQLAIDEHRTFWSEEIAIELKQLRAYVRKGQQNG